MPRSCAHASTVAAAIVVVGIACQRTTPPPPAPAVSTSATGVAVPSAPRPDAAASAPSGNANGAGNPGVPVIAPATCAVAYATWPPGTSGPMPGDDLTRVPVPLRIPEGGSMTIAMRKSGHEVAIRGPALLRPCTRDEPDVLLLASGEATTEASSPVRPGSEIFVATPSSVAVIARASLRLTVSASSTQWELTAGDATLTTLDVTKTPAAGERGGNKRFPDSGLLLTRCGVQVTATANAERMLASIGTDAAPPLPSASIGVLAAEEIRHARERVLDCSFAEAFALSCDALTAGGTAKEKAESGCKRGYVAARAFIADAASSTLLPPGSPRPLGDGGP
ncbi:MAG: hypothetical protein NVSMB47_06660 [Polyangiales bacterium]